MADSTAPSLGDAVAVRLTRRLEAVDGAPQVQSADSNLALPDALDRLNDEQKITVITRRARAFLVERSRQEGGLSPRAIDRTVNWLGLFLVVGAVLLVAVSFLVGWGWLLEVFPTPSGPRAAAPPPTIRVQNFVSLTLIQLVLLIPPLLVLVTSSRRKRRQSWLGDAASLLFRLGTLVPRLLVRSVLPRLGSWLLGRNEPAGRAERILSDLDELGRELEKDFQFVGLTFASVSLTGWFIVCLGLFLSASWKLGFNQYNYEWKSALWTVPERAVLAHRVGLPMRWLSCVPDADAVSWAATDAPAAWPRRGAAGPPAARAGGESPAADIGEIEDRAMTHRACWSDFLIKLPVVYGLLPRIPLLIWAWLLLVPLYRRLQPDLSDAYYQTILSRLEEARQRPRTEEPPPPPPLPEGGAEGTVQGGVSGPELEPLPEPPPPPGAVALEDTVVVFGLRSSAPPEGWSEALLLDEVFPRVMEWEPTQGNDAEFGRRVAEAEERARLVVVAASCTLPPDRSIRYFLADLRQALPDACTVVIVATDQEQTRRGFGDNRADYDRYMEGWRNAGSGLRGVHVWDFDHECSTIESRRRLAVRWRQLSGGPGGPSCLPEPGLALAGRFPDAADRIVARVQAQTGRETGDQLRAEATALHKEILQLYREQAELFRGRLPVAAIRERLRDAVWDVRGAAAQSAGDLKDLAEGAALVRKLNYYLKELRPGWLVAGGVAAALAGAGGLLAAAPLMPAAVLPLLLGATPVAGAGAGLVGAWAGGWGHLIFSKAGAAPPADSVAPDESEAAELDPEFRTDDLVRGAALWALVLELQGNPPRVVAETLRAALDEVAPDPINDADQADVVLSQVVKALARLARTGGTRP